MCHKMHNSVAQSVAKGTLWFKKKLWHFCCYVCYII